MATRYDDKELLGHLGLLDDILWMKEHTYRDLILEFLSTLHVEVTRGAHYQARYISSYLQGQFYELNLGTVNNIFGFPPSMDLPNRQVLKNSTRMHFWASF